MDEQMPNQAGEFLFALLSMPMAVSVTLTVKPLVVFTCTNFLDWIKILRDWKIQSRCLIEWHAQSFMFPKRTAEEELRFCLFWQQMQKWKTGGVGSTFPILGYCYVIASFQAFPVILNLISGSVNSSTLQLFKLLSSSFWTCLNISDFLAFWPSSHSVILSSAKVSSMKSILDTDQLGFATMLTSYPFATKQCKSRKASCGRWAHTCSQVSFASNRLGCIWTWFRKTIGINRHKSFQLSQIRWESSRWRVYIAQIYKGLLMF